MLGGCAARSKKKIESACEQKGIKPQYLGGCPPYKHLKPGYLKLHKIDKVTYHGVILVLRGVSLEVGDGKIISLLGANGAGKSTTLKAISGLLKTEVGRVSRSPATTCARPRSWPGASS